jgi:hypothetical protein
VIPPKENAEFVCAMEDVLDLYHEPYDPERPMVCFDESSKELRADVRECMPLGRGQQIRQDYEYHRLGTRNLFMLYEPLVGWRHVEVTEHRKKEDWAHIMRQLVDDWYPNAKRIRVIMDNLNTHKLSTLYKVFDPAEARRLCQRLEIHYTPKHGSWLNMAEIEFSVLVRQCLDRRIPQEKRLRDEIEAWERERNCRQTKIDWQFSTADARIKLRKLYPSI